MNERERQEMFSKALFDPAIAIEYCRKYGRDKRLEEIISIDSNASYAYATGIIQKRFRKGEDAIARDPLYSVMYAELILKRKFPKGHKAIAQHPRHTYSYLKTFFGYDLSMGTAMSMSPEKRLRLINRLSREKFKTYKEDPRFELAQKDVTWALQLCKEYGPIPELEFIISLHPDISYHYATKILKAPFPKGERVIYKDKRYRRLYEKKFEKINMGKE